ncbi:hypothetical protein ACHWQZ_G015691 [Mnemiopsis leidyi]
MTLRAGLVTVFLIIIRLSKAKGDTVKVQPVSVESSSQNNLDNDATKAIDNDFATQSHTECEYDTDIWYRMNFESVHCFTEVVMVNSAWSMFMWRMKHLKVFVLDTKQHTEGLCGSIELNNDWTQAGQTYRIPCDSKCGDKIELRVRHDEENYNKPGCIHIFEIEARESQEGDTVKVQPVSVESSSQNNLDNDANKAIDNDFATQSHTECEFDTDIWYRMNFESVHCFTEVVMVNSAWSAFVGRMKDLKVFVLDTRQDTERLCGSLELNNDWTWAGQTYRIPCDSKCGDKIELRVRHDEDNYNKPGCIHMYEIEAWKSQEDIPTTIQHPSNYTDIPTTIQTSLQLYRHTYNYTDIPTTIQTSLQLYRHSYNYTDIPTTMQTSLQLYIPTTIQTSLQLYRHPYNYTDIPTTIQTSLQLYTHPYNYTDIPTTIQTSLQLYRHPYNYTDIPATIQTPLQLYRHPYNYTDIPATIQTPLHLYRHPYNYTDIPTTIQTFLQLYRHPYNYTTSLQLYRHPYNYTDIPTTIQTSLQLYRHPYNYTDIPTTIQTSLQQYRHPFNYTDIPTTIQTSL